MIYIPGTHRDQEGQALYEQDPEGAHTTFASESLQCEARSLCRPLFSSLCEGTPPTSPRVSMSMMGSHGRNVLVPGGTTQP